MPNHVHLLLKSGKDPIGKTMQSVLGGYAGYYNRRHSRSGHLFQGRFKSVLCEEEPYLMALVRYIHLNPLRAGLVHDIRGLEGYRWCGHGALVGKKGMAWQDTEMVLGSFGTRIGRAREAYREFVKEGMRVGEQNELEGGGLIRSVGGIVEYLKERKTIHQAADERILGGDEFVQGVLREAEVTESQRSKLRRSGLNPETVMRKAARAAKIKVEMVKGAGRSKGQSIARALFAKWMVEDLGYSGAEVAGMIGVTKMAVSKGVARGREIERAMRVSLKDGSA